jgi:hypothetical protein
MDGKGNRITLRISNPAAREKLYAGDLVDSILYIVGVATI